MTTVATNLLGRWVRGRRHWRNPEDLEGQVVAVTSDGEGDYEKLKFWVLIDGKPVKLTYATVMPEGWSPCDERL